MFFNAASIPLGGTTELIFNLGDSADPANYTNVRFTDTLPSGIIVATPNGLFNNCGGTVTAAAGSSTITLAGVTLAANAFCTIRVTVLATSAGVKANTVILRSDQGDSPPDTDNMTVTKGDTTVATTASPNPSVFGQLVTFTATVSSGLAIPIPTGTVTFKDGAITLGTATLDGNGRATFTTTALEVGSHTITAVYAGDANFNGSTSAPLAQDIARARTVAAIRRFLGARNDLLLSNNPNSGRQIDRLEQAQSNGSNQATGSTDVASLPGTAVSSRPVAGFYGRDTVAGRMSLSERVLGAGTEAGGTAAPVSAGGATPFNLSDQEDGPTRTSFSTSFGQMMRATAERDAGNRALGLGGMPVPRAAPRAWDVWIEGRHVRVGDDRDAASLNGSFDVLYVGADYVVNPSLLVGALVQYDRFRQTSHTLSSNVEGWGWMAGPYATVRLSQHLFLQGRAAWGRSDNDISPYLTYEDHFTSQRWLASSTLAGRWQFGPWQFRPTASIAYIEDASRAYVDTLGIAIPQVKATLGQASFGPEVAYRFSVRDGSMLEPYVSLQGIWSFAGNATDVVAGTPVGPDELRGKVEVGVKAVAPSGLILDLSTSYDGVGSGSYQAISGRATVRVPLN